jgi:hypothetical protein
METWDILVRPDAKNTKGRRGGQAQQTSRSWSHEVKVPVFLGGLPESFGVGAPSLLKVSRNRSAVTPFVGVNQGRPAIAEVNSIRFEIDLAQAQTCQYSRATCRLQPKKFAIFQT